MAATPSMSIRDTERDRRPLYLFDDENRAKVRRPIGAIDHDGWTYVTYGPLENDDWDAHPVQPPNDAWANFTQAVNDFAQSVNNFVNTANAPTFRHANVSSQLSSRFCNELPTQAQALALALLLLLRLVFLDVRQAFFALFTSSGFFVGFVVSLFAVLYVAFAAEWHKA